MKRRTLLLYVIAGTVLAIASVAIALGQATAFSASNYYVFKLQGSAVDLNALSLSVQSDGFTVVQFEDGMGSVRSGGQLSTVSVADALSSSHLLVLDGSRFLFRAEEADYSYALRPAAPGLELVFSPMIDASYDALLHVLFELQELGLIGAEVDFGSPDVYVRDVLKGPAPPAELRIDSDLYGLMVAEDWFSFASAKAISLTGLRVDVVAEIQPDALIPAQFFAYVVGESGALVELLLPIEQLAALAGSSEVALVRQAYQPVAP